MQIKINLEVFDDYDVDNLGLIPPIIIEVPNDADFLTVFTAINETIRDESINHGVTVEEFYEDHIQSIDFDAEGRLRLGHLLDGYPS